MTHKAISALARVTEAHALLTYAVGELCNGDPLARVVPQLDELQRALSHVTALLVMDPDIAVEFGVAYPTEESEATAAMLDELVQIPSGPVLAHLTAHSFDQRRIAAELCSALDLKPIVAMPGKLGFTVDISDHLDALLEHIDPYGEDNAPYTPTTEEEDDEA